MALTTYLKSAIQQDETYLSNGIIQDVAGVDFPLQSGVPVQPIYMFDVIPAVFSTNCISSENSYRSSGQPLNTLMQGTAPNITAIPVLAPDGLVGMQFDCERCLSLTFYNGNLISNTTVTVTGFDYLKKAITFSQALTGTVTTVTIPHPLLIVTSVKFSNDFNAAGSQGTQTVSVGSSNVIGLPYYLPNSTFTISTTWNGAALPLSAITAGNNWRVQNPSATTAGIRGYVTLPSAANGTTAMLTCVYYVYGADSEISTEMNILNQSSLKIANVQTSTGASASKVLPLLTKYDITGVAYPGDNAFMYQYNQLKAS